MLYLEQPKQTVQLRPPAAFLFIYRSPPLQLLLDRVEVGRQRDFTIHQGARNKTQLLQIAFQNYISQQGVEEGGDTMTRKQWSVQVQSGNQ